MSGATLTPRSPTRRKAARQGPGRVPGVETFAPGAHPGDEPGETWDYSDDDVETIVKNFAELSAGENPVHKVPVVLTHDDVYAHGWVEEAYRRGKPLITDWADVDPQLQEDIKARKLLKVSPEIKRDFQHPDGRVTPGPYLYRVAVIGADVPRAKGLADLPRQFADTTQPGQRIERVFRFADPPPADTGATIMDRAAALQFLSDMGVDPSVLGPDVPDAALIAIATAWQSEEDIEPADAGGTTPMSEPPPAVTVPPTPIAPKKVTTTRHFAERQVRREVRRIVNQETAALKLAAAQEQKAREDRARAEREASARLFCDRAAKDRKLTPADNDEGSPLSVRSRLLRIAAQPPAVHKFTDPATKKETSKTELELQFDEIDKRPAQQFSERVRSNTPGGTPAETGAAVDPFTARVNARYKEAIERHDAITGKRRLDGARN
jgi:hypothetical protein